MGELKTADILRANMAATRATIASLDTLAVPLARAVEMVAKCLLGGGKLLTCGNGGSAADASHLATEFVCRYSADRRPYAAIALTESGSSLTAIPNDYSFEQLFARQVQALARPGDLLIAFSTSGNSRNVLLALAAAREAGAGSIAFLGRGGGMTRRAADVELIVPSDVTARVQEAHLFLYHCLCESVEPLLSAPA